ncbi:ATP-binding protein [Sphingomonas sp. PvP056]|uniref:sensor histidine kinase n=1 Tax=Sphingomonas sp. PvP056 TaxID=3156392 RepID=UPI003399DF8A
MKATHSQIKASIALMVMGLFCILNAYAAIAAPTQPAGDFDSLIANTKAMMQVDPSKALVSAVGAQRVAAKRKGREGLVQLATAKWLTAEAYLRLSDTAQAAPELDRAISLAKQSGITTKLNGDLLLSKGGLLQATASFADALKAYQLAHNIFRDIGETRSQAISLINISILYQEAEDYKNAIRYNGEALAVYKGDPGLLFSIYGSLGIDLNQLGRLAEAQVMYDKALKLAREMKSPMLEARTLRNIARGQLEAGKLALADRTIAEGLRVSRGEDAAQARRHFLELSAQSAVQHRQYRQAERLIQQSFDGVDVTTTTLDMRDAHQTAYRIYHQLNDEHQALIHLEALKRLDDETSKLSASANSALAAARFDFANQETRIAQLKQVQLQRDIDDAALRARTQQTIFGGLAIAGGIIVGMLVFGLVTIRRSRNEVRRANVDLAETNAALGKALAAKTEFLATTSHEIRTPLNGILGMTQVMLADGGIDPAVRDRITVVHGAGITMRALVDDILDVAKMETGNLTIEAVPFDLRATLQDVSRLWEDQSRARGVSFVLDLARCPAFIVGDSARLRQIAFNLLSNALKFTERGTVTLRAVDEGGSLAISVEDSGIGIPADKIDLIFESFRQADAGTARKFGGTGLGLSICRNLARAMDGDISVASVPGEGSTFTVRIPLVHAADPASLQAAADQPQDALLIVDRNPISRSMLRALLEARAGTVVFAASVDEALDRLARGGISRILVDEATIRAEVDSDAAMERIGQCDVSSFLLWSTPKDADLAHFAALGIDQVIAKPIAGNILSDRLFRDPGTQKSPISGVVSQAA